MDVGLIGLGRMGAGIAKSLLRAGHRVTAYNRTRERAEALRKDGAAVAGSVADACQGDAVLTMLADDAAVEAVVFGEGGILKALSRGRAHVSLSTISVALSDRLATEHDRAGQEFIAAPVFGRPEAAEAGKLAIVAAGPKAAVERCKPLWEAIGQKLLVIGEQPSKANVVKLTGNFLIATVLESLGEAIAFARKSGVDAAAQGKHDQVGFALPLGLKDVRLVLEAADAQRVPMPIASVLHDRFLTALARGHERSDWSVVGQVAAEDAGLARAQSA